MFAAKLSTTVTPGWLLPSRLYRFCISTFPLNALEENYEDTNEKKLQTSAFARSAGNVRPGGQGLVEFAAVASALGRRVYVGARGDDARTVVRQRDVERQGYRPVRGSHPEPQRHVDERSDQGRAQSQDQ